MISVTFKASDIRRYMLALAKVKAQAIIQRDDMQYHSAVGFHHLLINNLVHERFKGGGFGFGSYAPYNPRYAAWKGSSSGFWILDGDLVSNIVKRKMGRPKGWAVGVNDVPDSGKKSWLKERGKAGKRKSIGMYAIMNEFGDPARNFPARPLFRPTREEYAKDHWPKEGMKSLVKIGNQWR